MRKTLFGKLAPLRPEVFIVVEIWIMVLSFLTPYSFVGSYQLSEEPIASILRSFLYPL
jgi:hypothetical protein